MLTERLRAARKKKGVTMTFIAKELGYKSVSGYANIEYGITKLSFDNAIKISKTLGMPLNELFFE